jgi:hypothetical protein
MKNVRAVFENRNEKPEIEESGPATQRTVQSCFMTQNIRKIVCADLKKRTSVLYMARFQTAKLFDMLHIICLRVLF